MLGEKETLGFYLTGHPLNQYLNELANFTTCRIAELHPSEHKTACAAGIITNIRTRQTKRGDRIAIFTLDDGTTQIEVVCFSESFQKYRSLIVEDQLIVVEGEVSIDDFSNNARIAARELYTMDQARAKYAKGLQISVNAQQEFDIQSMQQVLSQHLGGSCPVILQYIRDDIRATVRLGKSWLIKPTDNLLMLLKKQLPQIEEINVVY